MKNEINSKKKTDKIFDRIAGYAKEKEELMRLCEVIRNREEYRKKGARPPKGIVFYGEAGTGKTLFATVMSTYCDLPLIKISPADSASATCVNDSIRTAVEEARRHPDGCIVYFDELDKVLPNDDERYYTDASKAALIQLLTFIDGMDSSPNTVFIATCNYYNTLPTSLTRPGRLDKKMHIGLPTAQSREAIIKMYTDRSSCHFEKSVKDIAKLCKGFSCAALESMVNECVIRSRSDGTVPTELIKRIICEISGEDITRTLTREDALASAYRSIGSLAVARELAPESDYTVSLDGDNLGNDLYIAIIENCTYDDDDEYGQHSNSDAGALRSRFLFSKTEHINAITILLGGYAAEELLLGDTYANLEYVFRKINTVLFSMAENGMLGIGNHYSYSRNNNLSYSQETTDRLNAIFDEITADCYNKAVECVKNNRAFIERLVPVLIDKTYLAKDECEAIISDNT